MKTLEETITAAMDVSERELLPFLPYILQDFWELGADPDIMIRLIEKQFEGHKRLTVLDLGCGKGPVSVKIAKRLGYKCYGVDAIPDFIDYAIVKAKEYDVSGLCKFEVGDIREHCLTKDGIIIIDDGYIEYGSCFSHPQMIKKQELLKQISAAGMVLIDETIAREDDKVIENYNMEYDRLEKRCRELIIQYPGKADLFSNYMKIQKEEYNNLKFKVIGATMVLKREGLIKKIN
ncbi:MAG: class I SAM-dependent methyltransferase [Bacteroidales bacterium]|nr:class I SAM-dependent methyltransferase [Bacteroidales bacterium]